MTDNLELTLHREISAIHRAASLQAEAQTILKRRLSKLPDVGLLIVPVTSAAALYHGLGALDRSGKPLPFGEWFLSWVQDRLPELIEDMALWLPEAAELGEIRRTDLEEGQPTCVFLDNAKRISAAL